VLETVTPATLFHTQILDLQQKFPAVLNGEAEGIHTARVAIRRVRELLPLLDREPRWARVDDLQSRFKRIGKSLGRVRDEDVRVALLDSLQQRIPHAAPTLVLVRQQCERDRLVLMRKLIKRLERLDAAPMIDALARSHPMRFGIFHPPARAAKWRRDLRMIVQQRAQAARETIAHATGVYFPNRTHSVRIAIKRLRYATEIVHQTRLADRSRAIRALKKAQDLLGNLHDRQELSDHLADEVTRAAAPTDDHSQVALVRQVIDAEARQLHQRYAERRERLIAVCCDSLRVGETRRLPAMVAVAAVIVSSGVLAARRSRMLRAG
jgi:CHAD domain-containing protein